MLLRKIKTVFSRIHYRLTLIFILIFVVSSVVLFAFSFYFLYSSVRSSEAEEARRRLLNYWALYQADGIDLVIEEIEKESYILGERPFFSRIADSENITLYLRYPESWSIYNIEKLQDADIKEFEKPFIIKAENGTLSLEVYTVMLSDEYILQIGLSTSRSLMILRLYQRTFIFLLIGLILFGFITGILVSGRFLSPLRSLNSGIKEIISTGDFSKRIETRGINDDLEEIIVLFNTMISRIETLIFHMKENMDTVAHDLRTPMTIFRGYAEQALKNPGDQAAVNEALYKSVEQSERILSMLNTIMDVSEAETGTLRLNLEDLDLAEVLQSLTEMYEIAGEEKEISFELNTFPCRIKADPVRIRQAVGNIMDNAVKYSRQKGTVRISMTEENDKVSVRFNDNGPGIAEEDIPHIWERLYRSREAESVTGTGLGLSLVRAVMMAHNGTAEVISEPGLGAEFILTFRKGT